MSTPATDSTERERHAVAAVPHALLIGGVWRESISGRRLAVDDPSTGTALCEVPDGSAEDGAAAMDAASAAFPGFAAMSPRERGEILRRAYAAVMERIEELSLLMTLEMGKPLADSRGEVAYAADFLRWFSEESVRIDGRYSVSPGGGTRLLVMRRPVGPCILVTPWNFPMAMGARKIAPAIAAGCTMVVKPASQTPLSMLALADILAACGLPDGVLNVVTTSDAQGLIDPLLVDPRARKLSFTGSTAVGRRLAARAADRLLRVSLELGGNAPFIVMEDANLDRAVDGAMVAKMRNMGEACTAANRFLVAASVADDFASRLAARMAALRVGRGTEEGVAVGPLIDDRQFAKVRDLVDDSVGGGARILTGGGPSSHGGRFFAPTVLTDVPKSARLRHEEIFGPVAPVIPVADEDEALREAMDTDYGLVAYIFTRDVDRALRMSERLEVGMIGLNQGLVSNAAAPFGGVKQSGYGREGGSEGIGEYLHTRYVAISVDGGAPSH